MADPVRKAKDSALEERRRLDERLDEALDETFPASDPIAVGRPTATERPRRPVDRKAPSAGIGRAVERGTRKRRASR
jgi:hypothetical protein